MPNTDALRQAGRTLRELAESTPVDRDELAAWYERARQFEAVLRSDSGALSDAIPHFVWHYLADADIRVRDLAYRADQQATILEIIVALESGHTPACGNVRMIPSTLASTRSGQVTVRVTSMWWMTSPSCWIQSGTP